jgi:thioredoxin-dependent peroxiredoxin
MTLRVGDLAPDFDVVARQAGQDRRLVLGELLEQKNLVLYFYPRDFTTVCTRETCGFRDAYAELTSSDTEVVGVSVDDAATHDRFAREHGVTFPLVPDSDRALARRYGATSLLRDLMGVSARLTFVIARSGRIVAILDSEIRASQHTGGAREAIQKLRAQAT